MTSVLLSSSTQLHSIFITPSTTIVRRITDRLTSVSGKVVIFMSCFIFCNKTVVMTTSTIPIRPTISLQSVSTKWLVVGFILGLLVIMAIIAVVIIFTVILCKRKKSLRYFITFLCQHVLFLYYVCSKSKIVTEYPICSNEIAIGILIS